MDCSLLSSIRNFRFSEDDIVKAWIILAFIVVSSLLYVYSTNPAIAAEYPDLSRLTTHLYYIPILLTLLWFPRRSPQCAFFISLMFISVIASVLLLRIPINIIELGFFLLIYAWIFAATSVGGSKQDTAEALQIPPKECRQQRLDQLENSSRIVDTATEYIGGLIRSLASENREVRDQAALALNTFGEPAVDHLIPALRNGCSITREMAAKTLGAIGDPRATGPLMQSMKDDSRRVRETSAQALAAIGEAAVPDLRRGLDDPDWHVRVGSIIALRIIGGEDPAALLRCIQDENLYVRREAVKSLGRMESKNAVEQLCIALSDEDAGVRLRAAGALGRIRDPSSVTGLRSRLFTDPEPAVRKRAAEALGAIGTAGTLDSLRQAIYDPDPAVRETIQTILLSRAANQKAQNQ